MNSTPDSTESQCKLIFISYAYEDEVFAKWLARKLAFYGYGVWFDQIKLLGGESWVKDVDLAIKERSFRVVAVLSKASIDKPNPRKERTLAQQIGKERKIDDFLITLNLDGSQPDWTLSDISWISFRESWAQGLNRLLKKFAAIEAPQIHLANPSIARVDLDRGEGLVSDVPEDIVVNWLPFVGLPEVLRVYDAPGLSAKELAPWPCFILGDGKVAALSPPPATISKKVTITPEAHLWAAVSEIRRSSTHHIIIQILNKTVGFWLRSAGCEYKPETKATYMPDPFREESIYRYDDADGTKRRIHTSGKTTIKKPAAPPEKVIHHPAVNYRARKTDGGDYVLELKPALALFDAQHHPIEGRKIGPRRKKIARGWYNPHWRKRLMAFAQLLKEEAARCDAINFRLASPIRLSCDRSLVESGLLKNEDETQDEPVEQEIEVPNDEMEEWRE